MVIRIPAVKRTTMKAPRGVAPVAQDAHRQFVDAQQHKIDRAAGADILGARQAFFQVAEQVGDGLAEFLLVGDRDARAPR